MRADWVQKVKWKHLLDGIPDSSNKSEPMSHSLIRKEVNRTDLNMICAQSKPIKEVNTGICFEIVAHEMSDRENGRGGVSVYFTSGSRDARDKEFTNQAL